MVFLAEKLGVTVTANFNGYIIRIKSGDNPNDILAEYDNWCEED
jgi:hypothetical protein